MINEIYARGVRVHNLKNIDVKIPRDKFVVFTGLSGSGKSSLAFDTIYAEGHRRFVESLSAYARMFLGQLDKPDIDYIEGLSPSISIDQKTTSRNPRSTVGTVTEIYDYLRLLYARIGIPHCPICGREIRGRSAESIIDELMEMKEGTKFMVLAPVVRGKKGMHEKVISDAAKSGYVRIRIDGSIYTLDEEISLDKNIKHTVEIVTDRLVMRSDIRVRLAESIETALKLTGGVVTVADMETGEEKHFSQAYACEEHGISLGDLTPRMFSFNNPFGACPKCAGLGDMVVISPAKVIPDMSKSLRGGAIVVNGFKTIDSETWGGPIFEALGEKYGFTLDTPICEYSEEALHALLYGTTEPLHTKQVFGGWTYDRHAPAPGIINTIENRYRQSNDIYYEEFTEEHPCPECGGMRLKKESLAVTVGGKNIFEFCSMNVSEAKKFVEGLKLTKTEQTIARDLRPISGGIEAELVVDAHVEVELVVETRQWSVVHLGIPVGIVEMNPVRRESPHIGLQFVGIATRPQDQTDIRTLGKHPQRLLGQRKIFVGLLIFITGLQDGVVYIDQDVDFLPVLGCFLLQCGFESGFYTHRYNI